MTAIHIRPLNPQDRPWVEEQVTLNWGSPCVVAHGQVFTPADLPGFIAHEGDEPLGLLTCHIQGKDCEVVTLHALRRGEGIGRLLLEAAREKARQSGCQRLWLITTNDNLDALKFYQKFGFQLCALRAGAVEISRQLKPLIPLIGEHGIPMRDELELELKL